MKSCVVTANYACDPNKVWLYLTKPTLNGWRRDVSSYEESDDGLKAAEKNTDGSETQIVFTRKEKPRCLSCNFQKGKINGTFTALLLGGGDATSVECTLDVNGLGLFTKPEKLLNERLITGQADHSHCQHHTGQLPPQRVGERASRQSEIFRVAARLAPSGPAGHLPRRGRQVSMHPPFGADIFFPARIPCIKNTGGVRHVGKRRAAAGK